MAVRDCEGLGVLVEGSTVLRLHWGRLGKVLCEQGRDTKRS